MLLTSCAAVNPSVTIYMYVPVPAPLVEDNANESGEKIKSRVSLHRMITYQGLMELMVDEELLKYGLPTDIWFHVE